jgi:hypothetical protein
MGRRGGSEAMMFANRINASTRCSIWRPEASPPGCSRAVPRQPGRGRATASISANLRHCFICCFSDLSALFLSLLSATLSCWAANEHLAWRVANGSSGLVHLGGAARLALETRREVAGMRRAYVASSIRLGTAAASFMAADDRPVQTFLRRAFGHRLK